MTVICCAKTVCVIKPTRADNKIALDIILEIGKEMSFCNNGNMPIIEFVPNRTRIYVFIYTFAQLIDNQQGFVGSQDL